MCILEFISLVLSLIFSITITLSLSYANSNYYFLFLLILFIPLLYLLIILLYALYSWVLSFFYKNKEGKVNKYFLHIIYELDKTLLHVLNIKIITNGMEKIDDNEVYLFVGNHTSNFDPIIFLNIFNYPFICVAKKEITQYPFVGRLINAAGFIFLDRTDPKSGAKSIFKARDILKNNIANVNIFPEGTRNKTNLKLLEFHAASFKASFGSLKKTVLCSIKGARDIRPIFRRNKVYVSIVDILDPKDFTNTQDMSLKAQILIMESLNN